MRLSLPSASADNKKIRGTVTQHSNRNSPSFYLLIPELNSAVGLDGVLVGLNHLLYHLTADASCLAGSDVAVVALLEVNSNLVCSLHFEVFECRLCAGNGSFLCHKIKSPVSFFFVLYHRAREDQTHGVRLARLSSHGVRGKMHIALKGKTNRRNACRHTVGHLRANRPLYSVALAGIFARTLRRFCVITRRGNCGVNGEPVSPAARLFRLCFYFTMYSLRYNRENLPAKIRSPFPRFCAALPAFSVIHRPIATAEKTEFSAIFARA